MTGKGQGESHGVYKSEHNSGCGNCTGNRCEEEPPVRTRTSCTIRSKSGGKIVVRTGSSVSMKVC